MIEGILELTSRLRRQYQTYVKVHGRWAYLYRAIDERGDTIDFHLSPTRNAKAAKRLPRTRRCVG